MGLGVKHLSRLNKVLLCQWGWRLANEKGPFWIDVKKGKYGEKDEEVELLCCKEGV